jgi:hypothetical protein
MIGFPKAGATAVRLFAEQLYGFADGATMTPEIGRPQ